MWRLSDAELNCVRTKMRRMSAWRHRLTGTSISRYLPPIGTAGFDRVAVSGKRRVPCPPPRMTASVSLIMKPSLRSGLAYCKRAAGGNSAGGFRRAAVQLEIAVALDELERERLDGKLAERIWRPRPIDDDESDLARSTNAGPASTSDCRRDASSSCPSLNQMSASTIGSRRTSAMRRRDTRDK